MMSKRRDVAWAAGLFEGEGSFVLVRRKRGEVEWRYAAASLCTTDEDVMRRFHRVVGVGRVRIDASPNRAGKKTLYRWQVQNRDGFARVAKMFRPHLGARRLARLAEVEALASPIQRASSARKAVVHE